MQRTSLIFQARGAHINSVINNVPKLARHKDGIRAVSDNSTSRTLTGIISHWPKSHSEEQAYLVTRTATNASNLRSTLACEKNEPGLKDFIKSASSQFPAIEKTRAEPLCSCDDANTLARCSNSTRCQYRVNQIPVYIRTYGCQMNVSDTSIIASILQDYGYEIISDESNAEIILLVTCAIRDSAESKIWSKLKQLRRLKDSYAHPLKQVGLLGCMAERLKQKVLETDNSVDIVAGPDAYRDLPRLFSVNRMSKEKAINCLLSFDETYSDIRPITSINNVSSFISITRGCDNLCSYCVVPFTRGRERSRPLVTILDEVKNLVGRGVKEVTLLGQNVNSYRDLDTLPQDIGRDELSDTVTSKESPAKGFQTVYKPRVRGLTFDILLEEVAKISPELRVRFTSPHPKDFTDQVIDVMCRFPNIARCIHLPAQSGSSRILKRMRRGYTKETYLDLVDRLKTAMPDLAITSDFISGFCGETDEDHSETIDLIKKVEYNFVYAFPYSERTKTHAYHKLDDDVPQRIKNSRVAEILDLFRSTATRLNQDMIGQTQLVLVESESSRSQLDWQGRNDQNIKTIIPNCLLPDITGDRTRHVEPGDYVVCKVLEANSQTLRSEPLYLTTQYAYHCDQMKAIEHRSSV